ncbi:MAG: hypothetical protein PVI06_10390 [Desulfobacterales bacterium]|jgi:hypothetical protein
MDRESDKGNKAQEVCEDLIVSLPCNLADRVKLYAAENYTTVTNVVIEALDAFLREQRMLNS